MLCHNWGPRHAGGNPVRWKKREFNKEADWLANHAMNTRRNLRFFNEKFMSGDLGTLSNVQGWSDGGIRFKERISAYAWLLKAWTDKGGPYLLTAGAVFIPKAASSSGEVEAMGMHAVWNDFVGVLRGCEFFDCSMPEVYCNPAKRQRRQGLADALVSSMACF
eukprot:12418916-Karenia_brevis.AAC.1